MIKRTLLLLIPSLVHSAAFSQESMPDWFLKEMQNDQLSFFTTIEGIWEGMPSDTSFISVLHYQRQDKQHFVLVDNDLLSKKRKPFSHYEGTYFFNPNTSRIEFTTINQSEIHSGYCQVTSDTLFHYATINRVVMLGEFGGEISPFSTTRSLFEGV